MTTVNSERTRGGALLRQVAAPFLIYALITGGSAAQAPLPEAARGALVDPAKGYFVEEIGGGLYWVTDGAYTTMFLTTGVGVIVVDAPPNLGPKLGQAIAEVTSEPITHVIYSHAHADHIGAAGMLPASATYIAHADTRDILEHALRPGRQFPYGIFLGGGAVPIPTVTFEESYTLTVGNQTLELAYRGDDHEPGNIYVYAPRQKVLLKIDVVFPGWTPFKSLALAKDALGYIDAHETILSYDFHRLVSGHFGRLATREDVEIQQAYVNDIAANAATALQTTDFMAIATDVGFENTALLFDSYLDAVAQRCAELTMPGWVDRLGGVDIWTLDHCETMVNALRLD